MVSRARGVTADGVRVASPGANDNEIARAGAFPEIAVAMSERDAFRFKLDWWIALPGEPEFPEEILRLHPWRPIASSPESPVVRRVPAPVGAIRWCVYRLVAGGYWFAWSSESGKMKKNFRRRDTAMGAVDAEIRRRERAT